MNQVSKQSDESTSDAQDQALRQAVLAAAKRVTAAYRPGVQPVELGNTTMSNFAKRRARCESAYHDSTLRIARLAITFAGTGFCVSVGFVVLTFMAGA